MLGYADTVGARRVEHQDTALAGSVEVDVVDSAAGAGDDAKTRCRGHQIGIDLRGAANDQAVGIGQGLLEVVERTARTRVDGPPRVAEEIGSGSGEGV